MAEGNNNGVRIYDVIERLEDILEGSPRPKGIGNNDKRVVDMSLFEDLLGDIKVLIPDDVRHANNILLESDRIIDGARQQSEDNYSIRSGKGGRDAGRGAEQSA